MRHSTFKPNSTPRALGSLALSPAGFRLLHADCETVTSLHKAFGGDATAVIKHPGVAIVRDML